MMHPSLYRPPTHIERYPMTEPCGTLISVAGKEDYICPTQVFKAGALERCPACRARRRKLALAKYRRKAGRS